MCFDICTINIRVSIRVRGLHLVVFGHLLSHGFVIFLSLFCRFLVVFYLIALFFRVFCQFPPSLQLGGRCPIFGFPASMFEFCCSPFAACTVTFFPFSWLRHSFLPFFCGSVIVSCASVTSCFLCGAVLFFLRLSSDDGHVGVYLCEVVPPTAQTQIFTKHLEMSLPSHTSLKMETFNTGEV